MAKRRTRKQKIKAKTQRVKVVEVVEKMKRETGSLKYKKIDKGIDSSEINVKKMTIRDLTKTGLISLLLFSILIGVYIYLK